MTHNKNKLTTQQGSAVIVALFVVSLVAAAAVAMMVRMHIDILRTTLLQQSNQSYLYAQGSVAWAIDTLITDWMQQQPNRVIDPTPIQSKTDDKQGYKITSAIYDMQSQFNLNNLNSANYQENFMRLLRAADPQLPVAQAKIIVQAISDWLGAGKTDEFDAYYAKLKPPYRAPHRPMASVSELRLVKGMTADLYNKLLPVVTVLPDTTTISVNNALPPVFMSLSPTLTPDAAKTLAASLARQPAGSMQILQNNDILRNNPLQADMISVTSNYFLVKTDVTIDQQHTILYTLLMRSIINSRPVIKMLWQTKGTL